MLLQTMAFREARALLLAVIAWLVVPVWQANFTTSGAGQNCYVNADCPDTYICSDSHECVCENPAAIPTVHQLCVLARDLGEECLYEEQCTVPHSTCTARVCDCTPGFYMLSDINATTCEQGGALVQSSQGDVEDDVSKRVAFDKNHMVPIMVVMGIMFIGMCVALNLFSRARFRNQRSVFNNPRLAHIKLSAKRKKPRGVRRGSTMSGAGGSRQASICSQISPRDGMGSQEFGRQPTDSVFSVESSTKSAHGRVRPAPLSNGPGSPTVIVANPGGSKDP